MAAYFGEPGADIDAPVAPNTSSLYGGEVYGTPKTGKSGSSYDPSGTSNYAVGGTSMSPHFGNVSGRSNKGQLTRQITTNMPVAPDMAIPKLGGVPAIDKQRMAQLSQERSAAGRRTLRRGMREAIQLAQQGENANVGSMVTRQALQGYGEGLGQVMGTAQKQAMTEVEYERGLRWQRTQAVFQAAMADYMQRFGTIQATQNMYSGSFATVGTAGPTGWV